MTGRDKAGEERAAGARVEGWLLQRFTTPEPQGSLISAVTCALVCLNARFLRQDGSPAEGPERAGSCVCSKDLGHKLKVRLFRHTHAEGHKERDRNVPAGLAERLVGDHFHLGTSQRCQFFY